MTSPGPRPATPIDRCDALLVDLDGVVYRGEEAVPGAAEALLAVRERGVPVQFLTNNSARTPEQVADRLGRLGVRADPGEILTSAIATASTLRREGWAPGEAFVIGERGIREALEGAGLTLVEGEPDRADLVVVGWDRSVDYRKLRTAALLVQRGARLVATNADATYPAPDGLWPGAGSILAAVVTATGAAPLVVGKPARPMFLAALERAGGRDPLVVGDRLDTDVAGAVDMGWDSLFVWTGAHGPRELPGASALPTYAAATLSALFLPVPPARFRRAGSADLADLRELLFASGLSGAGLESRLSDTLVTGDDSGRAVATASLERSGTAGLLRSVAVAPDLRGRGLGLLAVASAVGEARAGGLDRVWLFTETAVPFFERLGFRTVERSALPPDVAESAQAARECPASAAAMALSL